MKRIRLAAVLAVAMVAGSLGGPATSQAEFVESFEAGIYGKAENLNIAQPPFSNQWERRGAFAPLAGAHPFRAETRFQVRQSGGAPLEYMRDIVIEVPAGLVVNPQAVATCTRAQMIWEDCPEASQVGVAYPRGVLTATAPVYNMRPRNGVPAEFGFIITSNALVFVTGEVTSDGRIRAVSRQTSESNPLGAVDFGFFGVPYDPDNRDLASDPVVAAPSVPLVTSPTSCVGIVDTTMDINSWQNPGDVEHWVAPSPVGGIGCEELDFPAQASVTVSSDAAGGPTGLAFRAEVPQNQDPDGRAVAHVKGIEVELPEGMTVNPAAADGLAGCSPAQIDLPSTDPVGCPNGSRIGSVEIETPLLKESVGGSVYLATPYDNPFGSLLALYVVAENEERGIRLKIPGRVDVDQATGRLKAVFDNNPQLPFDALSVRLNGGDRAPLMLPKECGNHQVETRFSPWSAANPDNPSPAEVVVSTSRIEVRGCAAARFSPVLRAGSARASAAASSPFVLGASRADRDQEFSTLDEIQLPEGLLGYVSRVEQCDAAAADAGVCGPGSRVGRVDVAVGAGPRPAWLPQAGKHPTSVHLAGPYRGAPYSLSIVVPAQAGPFDLGRVVVRTPLNVDERTAQLSSRVAETRVYDRAGVLSQRIEGGIAQMIQGIPLRVRAMRVHMDRDGFMLNPTNCNTQQITMTAFSLGGLSSNLAQRFQTTDCDRLGFAPRFRARIMNKGRRSTLRSFNPRTKFVVVPRKGDANIGGARVVLPSSTILDQANIGTTCTRAQMAAEECPEGSIVGYAKAFSPVLNKPIRGPVYLAANGGVRPLPDLAAVLDGEVRLVLQGEISTLRTRRTARLQNTFRIVPDAPVSRFVLTMRGGKNRGLLVNSTDLCRTRERGIAVFTGQNGDRQRLRPRITTRFRGCKKARRRTARRTAKRKAARKSAIRSIAREAR